jgi:hypothetical protein
MARVPPAKSTRQRSQLATRTEETDGSQPAPLIPAHNHPVPVDPTSGGTPRHDLSRVQVHHEPGPAGPLAPAGREQAGAPSQDPGARQPGRELARAALLRQGGVPVDAGRGQALPLPLRDRLTPLVGSRAVNAARIHTDAVAEAHAASSRALAVAAGADIFFARGHYRPGTPDGDRLIAHEVAHIDQAQRDLLRRPAFFLASGSSSARQELDADEVASKLLQDTSGATPPGTRAQPAADDTGPAQAAARARGTSNADPADPKVTAGDKAPKDEAPGQATTGTEGPGATGPGAGGPGAGTQGQAPFQAALPAALPPGLPLMPAPAMSLSPKEQARVTGVQHRARAAAKASTTVPPAKANVAAAQAAVQRPQSESDARKAEQVAADLGTREKPSVEVVALGKRIKYLIKSKRPADEEGVIDTRPQEVAREAGQGIAGDVQGDVNAARNSYAPIAASPQGPAVPTAPGIAPIPAAAPTPEVGAATAAPDAIPAEQVSLDKDEAAMTAKAHDAGLDQEPAQLVTGGPIADARTAQGDMKQLGSTAPQEAVKQQQAALAQASAGMVDLQATALASLKEARAGHVSTVAHQQVAAKGGEEAFRTRLSAEAVGIFTAAQDRVEKLLRQVPEKAMTKWNAGLAPLTLAFNNDLKTAKDAVEERHSGVSGFFVAGWDALSGLPRWIRDLYDRAEDHFGDGVVALLTDISSDVNTVIKIADKIIDTAHDDIHRRYTTNLPADQREWAEKQLAEFDKKLDALHAKAAATRTSFTKDLVQKAGEAVQAAREQVQKARREAAGLWGRFMNALDRFLTDPAKFVIEGLLEVLGIPPRDFWAVVDKIRSVISDIALHPLRFANNLMAGVGAGFSLFFHKIGKHLLEGLLEWLLSGLQQEGITIEIPRDPTDLRSVIGFFLQLLGISWVRIRKLLVAEFGEQAVALIEKSVRTIQLLATKDIAGILDDIKAMLDPKTIIDNIIQTAISFIIERLIVKVAEKILLMLNPVGAILAAIEAIYRVLKWIFHNAARIFRLIEAVVNGIADIMAGNTGGVATMIDTALARMISPVIDFLADYASLGGLPGKVANAIMGLQAWVEKGMQAVIKWLVAMGRKALSALGFKGKDDKAKQDGHAEIGIHVPFEGGGEPHEIYIEVTGTDAEVMIHSRKTIVEKWLDEREKELENKDRAAQVGEKKSRDLIAEARKLSAETRKAAKAAKAAATGQSTTSSQESTNTAEQATEQDERALAVALKEIAVLFGTLSPTEVDPKLKATVEGVGGIVKFMRLLAHEGRRAGEITYDMFTELWRRTPNRNWLKSRFRGAAEEEGMHEWIPTNYIPRVIADPDSPDDFTDADYWIDLHHELRSDTALLIFTTDKWRPEKKDAQVLQIPQGHVGAISVDGKSQHAGQDSFHKALRNAFNNSTGIHSCINAIEEVFQKWIWNGKGNVPPLNPKVRGGIDDRELTASNIGDYQSGNYESVQAMFKTIRDNFRKAKT